MHVLKYPLSVFLGIQNTSQNMLHIKLTYNIDAFLPAFERRLASQSKPSLPGTSKHHSVPFNHNDVNVKFYT
jgi:hypothetical protein